MSSPKAKREKVSRESGLLLRATHRTTLSKTTHHWRESAREIPHPPLAPEEKGHDITPLHTKFRVELPEPSFGSYSPSFASSASLGNRVPRHLQDQSVLLVGNICPRKTHFGSWKALCQRQKVAPPLSASECVAQLNASRGTRSQTSRGEVSKEVDAILISQGPATAHDA